MKNFTSQHRKRKKLFLACLSGAIGLHLLGIFVFYKNPLVVQTTLSSLFKKGPSPLKALNIEEEMTMREKNQILMEVFDELVSKQEFSEKPYDLNFDLNVSSAVPYSEQPIGHASDPSSKNWQSSIQYMGAKSLADYPSLIFPEEDVIPVATEELPCTSFVSQIEIDKTVNLDIVKEYTLAEPIYTSAPDDEAGYSMDKNPLSELTDFNMDTIPLTSKGASAVYEDSKDAFRLKINPSQPTSELPQKDLALFQEQIEKEPLVLAKPSRQSENKLSLKPFLSNKTTLQLEQYEVSENTPIQDFEDESYFDINLQLMPHPAGEGYLFCLNLVPQQSLPTEKIRQNFYFLIDRSNSIEKHRYGIFKKAVLKALSYLQEGDFFNIFVFDKTCVKLSEYNFPFNKHSLRAAEDFLEAQKHNTHFSAADIYSSLDRIIPSSVKENELHTAILITDGNTLLDLRKQKKTISNWTKKNNGQVSLYTAAVGKDNNLMLLDLISTCNRGKLLYSETHSSFPRKLAKLVMTLRDPIARELVINAVPSDPKANISFYSNDSRLPNLFKNRSLKLLGTIDRLCEFKLYLQGKQKNRMINLAIPISFEEAKKGNKDLEKQWALLQAHTFYDRFLRDGKSKQLKQAQELLKNAGGEIVFEP